MCNWNNFKKFLRIILILFDSHFYDFDSKVVSYEVFDYSTCYQGKNKTEFGVKYLFPEGFNKDSFASKQEAIANAYYNSLFQVLTLYNFSPLRIINPTLVKQKDGFTLYSGITDTAPSLCIFSIKKNPKIDFILTFQFVKKYIFKLKKMQLMWI